MNKTNSRNKQIQAVDAGKDALLNGIIEDARKEAAEIIAQAENANKERVEQRNSQVKAILDDAALKAKIQAETITKNAASQVAVDSKRKTLKLREEIINRIMEDVRARFAGLSQSDSYSDILVGWISEAAIGLSTPQANINASQAEKPLITDSILRKAESAAERISGRKVTLTLSSAPPTKDYGIMATSQDGRTAYNNQIQTRIRRHESEIRKLIYHELFGD